MVSKAAAESTLVRVLPNPDGTYLDHVPAVPTDTTPDEARRLVGSGAFIYADRNAAPKVTVADLRARAVALGITVPAKAKRDKIESLLAAAEVATDGDVPSDTDAEREPDNEPVEPDDKPGA